MKKLVALSTIALVGFAGYRQLKKFQAASIVFSMKPEELDLPPKILQKLTKFALRILPYSGFCEITGCTHEVHANNQEGFHKAMAEHLSTDH